ncbi:DegV family protein [Mycolicibacterium palauense]|uniref:DegV family protein n=1 Tax=Mycolicibacterium palauense TaxID=2034511 RepID=UPI000BFED1DB|nr:DegV family protein [Mycolicibacterium palauense]
MPVVVVTDSSARLPADLASQYGIRVVPLHILVDGTDLRDGVDPVPEDIHERSASTAAAGPVELAGAYRDALAASDGDGVVAVHISSSLSATFNAGQQAAAEVGPAVRVIDSRSAAMGTGFVALAAARAAAAGSGLDAVGQAALRAREYVHAFIVVHRLDNLRRSGRIGGAAAWLGTALSLKPLLRIDEGKLVLAQRVRTASKAVATMTDRVCDIVGAGSARLAVHHVADPEGAAQLAATLAARLPDCPPALVTELGPVLALHVGAGALAVTLDTGTDTGTDGDTNIDAGTGETP